ncbi:MAG: hypothetical protein KBS81_06180, partial [Spirochaetales bacterium]|nr:hypothetical protein [Candidatus Physcosoma equi]
MRKTASLIFICTLLLFSLSAGSTSTAFTDIPVSFVKSATLGKRTVKFINYKNDEATFSSFTISGLLENGSVREKIGVIRIEASEKNFRPSITVTASDFFSNGHVLPVQYWIDCSSIDGVFSEEDVYSDPVNHMGVIDLPQRKNEEGSVIIEQDSVSFQASSI